MLIDWAVNVGELNYSCLIRQKRSLIVVISTVKDWDKYSDIAGVSSSVGISLLG